MTAAKVLVVDIHTKFIKIITDLSDSAQFFCQKGTAGAPRAHLVQKKTDLELIILFVVFKC